MTKVGLLSDTHSWWDEKYLQYFETCDEIWHAGDIGSVEVAQKLAAFRPFRAVYGNIDGQEIRRMFPQVNRFTVDGAEVLMKHIGGYPGNYDPSIKGSLLVHPPKLFISGHSHILKVKYDKKGNGTEEWGDFTFHATARKTFLPGMSYSFEFTLKFFGDFKETELTLGILEFTEIKNVTDPVGGE